MSKQRCKLGVGGLLLVISISKAAAQTNAFVQITALNPPAPGTLTISFTDSAANIYQETVSYGSYSSPASVASALSAQFARDYICPYAGGCTLGLGAMVIAPKSALIEFQLNNTSSFGAVTFSSTGVASFQAATASLTTVTQISITPASSEEGQDVVINATVSIPGYPLIEASGTIECQANGTILGAPTTLSPYGTTSITTSNLPAGSNAIQCNYTGLGQLEPSHGEGRAIVSSNGSAGAHITGLSSSSGPSGMPIKIYGSSFGASEGASKVYFNGTPAGVLSWSDSSITVIVPSGGTTGPVDVVLSDGRMSNAVTYTFDAGLCVL